VTAFWFARRYFISRQAGKAVNLIAWISMLGMFVGSLGLILVLSVFNGFESLVISLYNEFNPEFTVTAQEGKSFVPDSTLLSELKAMEEVLAVSEVIEENALFNYADKQFIGIIKGVQDNYGEVSGIDSAMYIGDFILREGERNYAQLGLGVAQALSVNFDDPYGLLNIYVPRKTNSVALLPQDAFRNSIVKPGGCFAIQAEFDSRYVFVPLGMARELTNYSREVTALEISAGKKANHASLQKKISALFGNEFIVKNRMQQNEMLYKVMKTEKWAVYAILTFILVVAAFNIIGSITILVIDKRDDMAVLQAIGASRKMISRIFLLEGILLSAAGCFAGFAVAIFLITGQQYFEWLKIAGQSFVIDAYPVLLKGSDLLLVAVTVMFIGCLAAWLPARRAVKNLSFQRTQV
jgi:lipoprotein-releasing system permease protein